MVKRHEIPKILIGPHVYCTPLDSELCAAEGKWTADYVRLRFVANSPTEANLSGASLLPGSEQHCRGPRFVTRWQAAS